MTAAGTAIKRQIVLKKEERKKMTSQVDAVSDPYADHRIARPSIDFDRLYERSPIVLNGKLALSASYGDENSVLRWLEYGARADANDSEALHSAALNGQTKLVELLIRYGADPHARGDKALVSAAEYGRPDTVKFLLKQSPAGEARNKALSIAEKNKNRKNEFTEVIDLLLEAGATRDNYPRVTLAP